MDEIINYYSLSDILHRKTQVSFDKKNYNYIYRSFYKREHMPL